MKKINLKNILKKTFKKKNQIKKIKKTTKIKKLKKIKKPSKVPKKTSKKIADLKRDAERSLKNLK